MGLVEGQVSSFSIRFGFPVLVLRALNRPLDYFIAQWSPNYLIPRPTQMDNPYTNVEYRVRSRPSVSGFQAGTASGSLYYWVVPTSSAMTGRIAITIHLVGSRALVVVIYGRVRDLASLI